MVSMPRGGVLTVEPVDGRAELRRFAEIPFLLLHDDPRWRAPVRAFDRWRLDARRHPYFEAGDGEFFLARRAGRPVGRIAAHLPERGADEGRFGFFDTPDDPDVAAALLDVARSWLSAAGAGTMCGPLGWDEDEEFGVQVDGYEHAAATGRPWHPPWYAERLVDAGATASTVRATYHLELDDAIVEEAIPVADGSDAGSDGPEPAHAGRYLDRSLVLDTCAAVPDVSDLLAGASVRTAWRAARAARRRHFDVAVIVRTEDAERDTARIAGVARRRGYRRVLAPAAPDERAPDRQHQVFEVSL